MGAIFEIISLRKQAINAMLTSIPRPHFILDKKKRTIKNENQDPDVIKLPARQYGINEKEGVCC